MGFVKTSHCNYNWLLLLHDSMLVLECWYLLVLLPSVPCLVLSSTGTRVYFFFLCVSGLVVSLTTWEPWTLAARRTSIRARALTQTPPTISLRCAQVVATHDHGS
jgi:hypothetical protein